MIVVALVLILSASGGYVLGIKDFVALNSLLAQFEQQSKLHNTQLDSLSKELQVKLIELRTEQAKSARLSEDVQQLTKEKDKLDEDLTLFKKALQPEAEEGGVQVYSAHLQALPQKNSYRLTTVLMQVGRTKPLVKGNIFVRIIGMHGEEQELQLNNDDVLEGENKDIKFSFKYVTEVETKLQLPDNFKADSISIRVSFSRGGYKGKSKQEKNYDWLAILNSANTWTIYSGIG